MEKYQERLIELENKAKMEKAIFLYKNGFTSEFGPLEGFNPDEYNDVTYKNGFKGFNVYEAGDGSFVFASVIDDEVGAGAYQGLIVENVSDEDYLKLKEGSKSNWVKWVVVALFSVFGLFFSLGGFVAFFDTVSSGFVNAIWYMAMIATPGVVLLAAIPLYLKKVK